MPAENLVAEKPLDVRVKRKGPITEITEWFPNWDGKGGMRVRGISGDEEKVERQTVKPVGTYTILPKD